jgi:DNA polymerase-1
MKQRILLLDGHSLAYRAYYALPVENFTTSTGQPTNAVYGFASMILNLIRDEKPTHIAAALDVSRKTFRSEKFPEYKANRAATPDEFRSQMSLINELLLAMNIPAYESEGFEADDIIATLVSKFGKDSEILICSGDRDSFQLVTGNVTVLYPKKGVTELARMTPAAIEEKYGVTPSQYPDFAALRGDPSDNLPSIPGVGEKTAAKWILEFGSLAELIAHADEISGKAGNSFRDGLEKVKVNRELTQLRSDVPIQSSMEDLNWSGPDLKAVTELFEKLEIRALRDRVKSLAAPSEMTPSKIKISEVSFSEFMEIAIGATSIAIDISPTQISCAINATHSYLIPRSEFKEIEKVEWIAHGAKPLLKSGLISRVSFDSEIAAYLLNPGSRDLEIADLIRRFLGFELEIKENDLFSNPWDPSVSAHIFRLQEVLLEELQRMEALELFRDIEIPTLHLLAEMESAGIGVDQEKLAALHSEFSSHESNAIKEVYNQVGHEFNVASPKQLQVVLFEELQLPKTKRIKTGYSTDADSLEWLRSTTQHPVLENLLRIRETAKLRTTLEGLRDAIGLDGRIHTTFQQTITATGRLSSTEPNLQNIPVRSAEGRSIRDCFIAQEPYVEILTADYSQIEMRIMAHLSEDVGLLRAFHQGEDLHSSVAGEVFGVKHQEVTPEMRRQIKAMSYGLAYGLSSYGLAQQLDITPTEASALMEKYFQRFGGIQDYLKKVVHLARERGFTETLLGRRRYLPELSHENRQRREVAERMALNAPIQGSAADIIKIAMIRVSRALSESGLNSRLLLQVHDELIFEVALGEQEELASLLRREMGEAYPLKAPLDVNIGFGRSWDLAAH